MALKSRDAIDKSENLSKGYRLMTQYGIIKSTSTGFYAFLPLGLRVLEKLSLLVESEMQRLGAQKILLPSLSKVNLWKTTKKFENNQAELFVLKDRHCKKYILNPTHEESICNLISLIGHLSPKLLPLKLYQISSKWRDEMKPRQGFLRSREFIMKDLYTFDTDLDKAKETYESVCDVYDNIFKQIGVPFLKAVGHTGVIGGKVSHEYHYLTDIGEDIVLSCPTCNYSFNKVIDDTSSCPKCKNVFNQHKAVEVGHSFLLDTKYSEPLRAFFHEKNKTKPLSMGCYGLGLSRLISVAVDILSTNDYLRWPKNLAPYTACLITPKAGSNEESAMQYVQHIIDILNELKIDTILDDRVSLTIGQRHLHARATGFPYIIIVGKAAMQSTPLFEIHNLESLSCITIEGVKEYFTKLSISDCNHV
ncbi:hypothetical protein KM043_003219 [Ampulex compressa]|nr:hypothetical protein KM043_003219 [Ampulex compressa]